MKSKEEIINEMFKECGGNIFQTINDLRIVSSHMERYAIEKQIEVLEEVLDAATSITGSMNPYNAIVDCANTQLTKLKSL